MTSAKTQTIQELVLRNMFLTIPHYFIFLISVWTVRKKHIYLGISHFLDFVFTYRVFSTILLQLFKNNDFTHFHPLFSNFVQQITKKNLTEKSTTFADVFYKFSKIDAFFNFFVYPRLLLPVEFSDQSDSWNQFLYNGPK